MSDPHHPTGQSPEEVVQQQAQAPVRKPLFTEEELHILHAEDRSAGAAIVVLMAGVFTIGLVMYLIIAYITSS